jgi:hypothetical protein
MPLNDKTHDKQAGKIKMKKRFSGAIYYPSSSHGPLDVATTGL